MGATAARRVAFGLLSSLVALSTLVLNAASPAKAAQESLRWVLQNGASDGRLTSVDTLTVTGIPPRLGGQIIPSTDAYVIANRDWNGLNGLNLDRLDVSNLEHLPNRLVGFEVLEQALWLPTLAAGAYDILFDNNQNGIFDEGVDEIIGADSRPGFTVRFTGSVSELDKQLLKEAYAAPIVGAAKAAVALNATVGILKSVDTGQTVARLGTSLAGCVIDGGCAVFYIKSAGSLGAQAQDATCLLYTSPSPRD